VVLTLLVLQIAKSLPDFRYFMSEEVGLMGTQEVMSMDAIAKVQKKMFLNGNCPGVAVN